MFVNLFDQEEKEKFLELMYKMATCDGVYAEEEKELLNNYKIEFGIDQIPDTLSVHDLVKFFAEKTDDKKKIVLFELYGMVLADDEIGKREKDMFEEIKKIFALNTEVYNKIEKAAVTLKEAYDAVYDAVF